MKATDPTTSATTTWYPQSRVVPDPEDIVRRAQELKDPDCDQASLDAACLDPDLDLRLVALDHPRVRLQVVWEAFLAADRWWREHQRGEDRVQYLVYLGHYHYTAGCKPGFPYQMTAWRARHGRRVALDEPQSERQQKWDETTRTTIQRIAEILERHSWDQIAHLLDGSLLPNHLDIVLMPLLSPAAGHSNPAIRLAVARHFRVDAETLTVLSSDSEQSVRLGVARNRDTDVAALAVLSSDSEQSVRLAVAENGNANAQTLLSLCRDESPLVRLAASRRLLKAL